MAGWGLVLSLIERVIFDASVQLKNCASRLGRRAHCYVRDFSQGVAIDDFSNDAFEEEVLEDGIDASYINVPVTEPLELSQKEFALHR